MQSSITPPLNRKPDSKKPAVNADIPSDSRDKKRLIPEALDITRTKEFWDKAVWS